MCVLHVLSVSSSEIVSPWYHLAQGAGLRNCTVAPLRHIRCSASLSDTVCIPPLGWETVLWAYTAKIFVIIELCFGCINPLNAELNPICHLLALSGAHHIFHLSRIRVKVRVPNPVAVRSKALICGRSLAGIAGSNLNSDMVVCCGCCVLLDRGLCVGLIIHPQEYYRVWCVWVWSWILDSEEALAR